MVCKRRAVIGSPFSFANAALVAILGCGAAGPPRALNDNGERVPLSDVASGIEAEPASDLPIPAPQATLPVPQPETAVPIPESPASGPAMRFSFPLPADTVIQWHYYLDHDSSDQLCDQRNGACLAWTCQSACDADGGTYDGHCGTDYLVDRNTPVYAAADGQVIESEDQWGDGCFPCDPSCGCARLNGNFVRLQHEGGVSTVYLHLEKGSVTTNGWVACGEQIGWVGTSGNSSAPHLHFQAELDGKPFDPYTGPDYGDDCGKPRTSWWAVQADDGRPDKICPN